jgi:hypothetical protein
MTFYNVHLYREIRLTYESIDADTAHAAAAIALDMSVGAADDIDDCDGESFAALVDVAGDENFGQSVAIDFESERLRKAAPDLLEALEWITRCLRMKGPAGTTAYIIGDDRMAKAHAAVAKAKGRQL